MDPTLSEEQQTLLSVEVPQSSPEETPPPTTTTTDNSRQQGKSRYTAAALFMLVGFSVFLLSLWGIIPGVFAAVFMGVGAAIAGIAALLSYTNLYKAFPKKFDQVTRSRQGLVVAVASAAIALLALLVFAPGSMLWLLSWTGSVVVSAVAAATITATMVGHAWYINTRPGVNQGAEGERLLQSPLPSPMSSFCQNGGGSSRSNLQGGINIIHDVQENDVQENDVQENDVQEEVAAPASDAGVGSSNDSVNKKDQEDQDEQDEEQDEEQEGQVRALSA